MLIQKDRNAQSVQNFKLQFQKFYMYIRVTTELMKERILIRQNTSI